MEQPTNEPENFSSQIRFALENYMPHRIDKSSLNAVLICGTGGSGIAGRIVQNYFQDKLDLPIGTVAGYLLPRYAGAGSLVIVWSYSGENEEALALYDIARERGCRLIVISSGGRLVEKARDDAKKAGEGEIILYPVEAATGPAPAIAQPPNLATAPNQATSPRASSSMAPNLTSNPALGYALAYQFQIIFELLGVYKKPDLTKIAAKLDNANDYRQQSAEIAALFAGKPRQKYIVVCDAFFEGAATRFCQQLNLAGIEAFINILPEGGYHVPGTYNRAVASNFIFLNSRLSQPVNLRFADIKQQLEKNGINPVELLVADASLDTLFHIVHLLDWVALQTSMVFAEGGRINNADQIQA